MKKLVLIVSSVVLSSSVYASGIIGDSHDPGNSVYEDFPSLFTNDRIAKNEDSRVLSQPEVGDSSDGYLDNLLKIKEIMP
jgi:hypothetical protein